MLIKDFLNIGIAKAQDLIPCSDGTMADPDIGCVATPAAILSPESSLVSIILNIANGFMAFVAGMAVITLIYGAIRYTTAAGSEEQINKAKRIMFWGVFGLVVALLAVFITDFILNLVGQ
ncbi:pilin [Patescibacteria group bacterium]|nr:pilin [Patescibacteria group bacterium]